MNIMVGVDTDEEGAVEYIGMAIVIDVGAYPLAAPIQS